MNNKIRWVFLVGLLLLSFIITQVLTHTTHATPGSKPPAPNLASNLPPLPVGLKNYLILGLGSTPDTLDWMKNSGTTWDARYTYLAGGVNTGNGWETWQWNQLPPGQYALDYMSNSYSSTYQPIFTFYQLLQSAPANARGDLGEAEKDYLNLNITTTMKAYFENYKLLLQKAAQYNRTLLIHIEPDFWGYMQKRNLNPNNIVASVKSSGFSEVAAYNDTVAGFAQALVGLRNVYAPKVLLAYHVSAWANTIGDLTVDPRADFNLTQAAQETANFYLQLNANYDLLFYDVSDRDADYRRLVWGQQTVWWDKNNVTFPNFNRFHDFARQVTQATGKRGMLWQVPIGNTIYCTMDNTPNHYKDNRPEYYLGSTNQHLQDLADSGIVGILFGAGEGNQTVYNDKQTGVSNGQTGNCITSTLADDDGGHLRLQARAYYNRGTVQVAAFAKYNASLPPGATIQLKSATGYSVSYDFKIFNGGDSGSSLNISAPSLNITGSAQISVTPAISFSLAATAGQNLRLSCLPTANGLQTATLSYTTNDLSRPTVIYSVQCTGLNPRLVTKIGDSGATSQTGTLSFALANVTNPAQEAVVFELESGNTINVTGQLPPVPANLLLDGGGCSGGQPRVILNGGQIATDGLRLQSGVTLRNLRLVGFTGKALQLLPGATGLKLDRCVQIWQS